MSLRTYTFEKVSGEMKGIVMWGREETVKVTRIDIVQADNSPLGLVRYSGERIEKGKERTFFLNHDLAFNLLDGETKQFFPSVVYSAKALFFPIVIISYVTIKILIEDNLPKNIHLKIRRETHKPWQLSLPESKIVTDIVGTGCTLEEKK